MKIVKPSAELIDDFNPADILTKIERCGRVSHLSESKGDPESFVRMLIKRGHESVLEHVSLTFHIICDRAIQNELVRHRHASFTVESTRYVKYNDLAFIKPDFGNNGDAEHSFELIARVIQDEHYGFYAKLCSCPPEIARAVLPLCLKSELYMTANLREWRHILKLRTNKAAHPQMRFIAGQILQIFRDKLPVIVEDIHVNSAVLRGELS